MMESGNTEKKWKLPSLNFKKEVQPQELLEEPDNRSTLEKVVQVIKILALVVYRLRAIFLSVPMIFMK